MDIKNKNQKKHNINVELDVNTQKANNLETSIDNAEIKALMPKKMLVEHRVKINQEKARKDIVFIALQLKAKN